MAVGGGEGENRPYVGEAELPLKFADPSRAWERENSLQNLKELFEEEH